MTRITQNPSVSPFEVFQTTTDSSTLAYTATNIGERGVSSDGREFVIVKAGAVDLAAGVLTAAPATVANHQNIAVAAAAAVGATTMTVTLGATAATANQYAGGYVIINASSGIGETYRIASHPAAALSTALVLTLEDPIVTALTTSSKACLFANPYNGVIISPTTYTGVITGVTLYPIAAGAFGWIQTKGLIACLSDATVAAAGLGIAPSTTTAGCVTVQAATLANIGQAVQLGVSAETRMIFINL